MLRIIALTVAAELARKWWSSRRRPLRKKAEPQVDPGPRYDFAETLSFKYKLMLVGGLPLSTAVVALLSWLGNEVVRPSKKVAPVFALVSGGVVGAFFYLRELLRWWRERKLFLASQRTDTNFPPTES